MSKPAVSDIFDLARARLGDDQIGGGEIFTNQILQPHFTLAYREMFRALVSGLEPEALAERFYTLPANTMVLDPATAGFLDFSQPEFIEWRPAALSMAITNVVVANSIATVTVASTASLATGQVVEVNGILGFDAVNSPNGMWAITVYDGTTVYLNGCNAAGTYTSGGTLQTGTGDFTPMTSRPRLEYTTPVSGSDAEPIYAWIGGMLRFEPSSVARELRIVCRISGTAPTDPTAVIQFDDCIDYLAVRTAGMAALAKGGDELANALKLEALGPGGESALGSGGLLRQLTAADIRNMQRNVYRRPPFRARRTGPSPILY